MFSITKINYKLLNEMDELQTDSEQLEKKRQILTELYDSGLKHKTLSSYASAYLTYNQLQEIYWMSVNDKRFDSDTSNISYPTIYENMFTDLLKDSSKLIFFKSFWIENFCLDIFIPKLMLAIEIDGGIHNDEIKMKKDNYMEKALQKYKISVGRINNSDNLMYLNTIRSLINSTRRVSSAMKKRMMVKIFINTIASRHDYKTLNFILEDYQYQNHIKYIKHLTNLAQSNLINPQGVTYNDSQSSLIFKYSRRHSDSKSPKMEN